MNRAECLFSQCSHSKGKIGDQHVVKYIILHGNKEQNKNKAEGGREGEGIGCRGKPFTSVEVVRKGFSKRAQGTETRIIKHVGEEHYRQRR